MPENQTLTGKSVDKPLDLVTNRNEVDETTEVTKSTMNPERETFNVEPLSTEDEMDAVHALLSLQDLHGDIAYPLIENEQLMPIGGVNLPIDAAPVLLELDQAQVDHAIAKITEQEEKEATTDHGTTQSAVDPATANAPTEDFTLDARLSSPQAKGEFKMTTHVFKLKSSAHTSVVYAELGN